MALNLQDSRMCVHLFC